MAEARTESWEPPSRAFEPVVEGEAPLWRRLSAEFVGTVLFVAAGTGAATVLLLTRAKGLGRLPGAAAQDPVISELLRSTFSDTLAVALTFATALAFLIYAFGGVSGAHFNPAVTLALAVSRRFAWGEVPLYWVAQCLGAIVGAVVIAGIYGADGASLGGTDILYGATVVEVELPQAVLAEAFIGFVLMTAIMAVAVDPRAPKGWSGLIIGLALAAGIMVTGAATGGSANFARSLGPFVASQLPMFSDNVKNVPWSDLLVYAFAPAVGAAAAALIYESVTGLETVGPEPQPGAATPATDVTSTEEPTNPTL